MSIESIVQSSTELPSWAKVIDCDDRTIMSRHEMDGPVCHVGSLLNKKGASEARVKGWRKRFADLKHPEVIGIDLFPGMNVDIVADLCAADFQEVHSSLIGKFGIVFCSALLEHVANPFAAARNIEAMIRPGGHLLFSGPWVWGYHPYPGDFWRISFDGLKALFPPLEWKQWWYSGTVAGVGIEVPAGYERKLFRQSTITGPAALISDRSMPYLNVGAVGQKL